MFNQVPEAKYWELKNRETGIQFLMFDLLVLALESSERHGEIYALNFTFAKSMTTLIKFMCKIEDYGYTVCDADQLLIDFVSIFEIHVAESNEWYYCWTDM